MPAYRCWSVALLAVVLMMAERAAAAAEQASPRSRIVHHSRPNGLIGLVLDRLGTPIKARFDGSDEIVALNPEPAPFDALTLRRAGGVEVHSDELPVDSAGAVRDQDAQPLIARHATRAQVQTKAAGPGRKLKQAAAAALTVVLDAPHLADRSERGADVADAVSVTDAALAQMLTSPIAHQTIAEKLRRIVIRDGGCMDIKLEGSTLRVEIIAANVGGPSSARLQSAIGDLL